MRKLLLTPFLLSTALAAQSWKAGVAKVVITPQEPIMLGGYADRNHPSEGVRQDLYAKSLALQDQSGAIFVIVTLDLVGIPRDVGIEIAGRARAKYGIDRERLVLNCSHTHSGPIVGHRIRAGYVLTENQEEVIRRYTAWFMDRVVEVIGDSIKDLQPAALAFGIGNAGFAVNRRRVVLRHLPGPVDHDVFVLGVSAPGGRLRAVVFSYACHATVLNDYQINGDWPGFAQAELEKSNPAAVAMFVAGCGADANPLPRRSVDLAVKYGEIMAYAVNVVLKGKMTPVSGPIKAVFETVDVPLTAPSRQEFESRRDDPNPARRRHAGYMLDLLDRDGKLPDHYPYPVEVWQFGRGLKFIALGGEVVVDYALRLRAQYGWDNTWVAGYSNDIFAYIPSLRVLKEGGYEGGDAMLGYGLPGPFGPAVEEIIVKEVGDLVQRVE